MVREYAITIPVTEQERKLIKNNAKLHGYSSTAAFLRDRALDNDISNKASLAVLMTWLSSKLGDFNSDKNLDWTRKKTNMKKQLSSDLAGMDKDKREVYLSNLDEKIDHALEVKGELESILERYFIE